jgi:hypothetical protein
VITAAAGYHIPSRTSRHRGAQNNHTCAPQPGCGADQFRLLPGETLAAVLANYAEVARRTDELVASLPSLNAGHPLPKAPWFEPGASWSARQVLLHIITETAQHAGHADIIRESLDGAKSMGCPPGNGRRPQARWHRQQPTLPG